MLSVLPPVMVSDYPFGDNAVVVPLLCLLITLLVIMLSVLSPVMASDYPFGDNGMKNAHSVAKKKYHDFQLSEQHVTIAAYSGYTVK